MFLVENSETDYVVIVLNMLNQLYSLAKNVVFLTKK